MLAKTVHSAGMKINGDLLSYYAVSCHFLLQFLVKGYHSLVVFYVN